ncbi:MAG: RNA 2',3'-cyclic phosphodiesterase [Thermoplasmatales archaeon]|nr:RNA 2',3'-cyclic phosphodiesterase [Thermoplasmatales archaeon]MCW6171167.1 RNA 2',3'-cyclic phosphodiesterase [Thermoplasmatales archaeon]
MRIFIACSIERFSDIQDLYSYLKEFESVRTVNTPELHLTFRFFGELNEEETSRLLTEFRKLKLKQFILRISGLGCFPEAKKARILYMNVDAVEEILLDYDLIARMNVGKWPEKRAFVPHITVARSKRPNNLENVLKRFDRIHLEKAIDHMSVYQSILTASGPVYKIMESVQLI